MNLKYGPLQCDFTIYRLFPLMERVSLFLYVEKYKNVMQLYVVICGMVLKHAQ